MGFDICSFWAAVSRWQSCKRTLPCVPHAMQGLRPLGEANGFLGCTYRSMSLTIPEHAVTLFSFRPQKVTVLSSQHFCPYI